MPAITRVFTANGQLITRVFTTEAFVAPTLVIDSPTDGTTLPAGTTSVNVLATPTAGSAAIADVEFSTDGGATFTSGAFANPEYQFTVATADNTGYVIIARAVDVNGQLSNEVQVTFSVGNFTAPTIVIDSPTAGQEFPAGTTSVTVTSTATAGTYPISSIEYSFDGGATWATSGTIATTDGTTYMVRARATDTQGNVSAIVQRTFSVAAATVGPQVAMLSPADGTTYASTVTNVSVTAIATEGSFPISVVSFSVNGGAFNAGTLSGGVWTANVGVAPNNSYTVRARATDTDGNDSSLATITFDVEPAPPTVTIVSPAPATSFAAGTTSVLLQAEATDGSNPVTAVEFSTDSGVTWTPGTFNGTFWETTVATVDGGYTALARALDGVGTESAFQTTSFFIGDISTRINTPDAATQTALQKTVRCLLRKVEIYNSDGSPYDLNPSFETFTVSVDKDRAERRTLTLTLRDEGTLGEDPTQLWYDKVIKVYRGFDVDGVEYLPLIGTFLLDRTARSHYGNKVVVTGRDLSKQLSYEFGVYEEYAINTPVENVIRDIAIAGGLDPARIVLPLTGVSTGKELVYESTGRRWDAMRELAESHNFDLFFDPDGFLRMFEHPRLVGDPVQWTFETGTNSNIGPFEKQLTDAPIRNQVTVIGSSNLSDFPPPSGQSTNTANGPTAANLIGLRPITLQRPELTTNAECQALAERLLEDYSKEQLNVSAEVMATPWLDANILVVFDRGDADDFSEVKRYILDSFQISSEGGTMPAAFSRLQT